MSDVDAAREVHCACHTRSDTDVSKTGDINVIDVDVRNLANIRYPHCRQRFDAVTCNIEEISYGGDEPCCIQIGSIRRQLRDTDQVRDTACHGEESRSDFRKKDDEESVAITVVANTTVQVNGMMLEDEIPEQQLELKEMIGRCSESRIQPRTHDAGHVQDALSQLVGAASGL